jgi:hypothetical protein
MDGLTPKCPEDWGLAMKARLLPILNMLIIVAVFAAFGLVLGAAFSTRWLWFYFPFLARAPSWEEVVVTGVLGVLGLVLALCLVWVAVWLVLGVARYFIRGTPTVITIPPFRPFRRMEGIKLHAVKGKEKVLPLLAILTGIALISLIPISSYAFPRGPSHWETEGGLYYKEDRSRLDLPGWVEFSRDWGGALYSLPGIALVVAGFFDLFHLNGNHRTVLYAVAGGAGWVAFGAIVSSIHTPFWVQPGDPVPPGGWPVLAVVACVVVGAVVIWAHTHPSPPDERED